MPAAKTRPRPAARSAARAAALPAPQAPAAASALPRDDLDRALITLLQADARRSAVDLARQLGVARTTVLARMARLQRDRVIIGYTARLGPDVQDSGLEAYVGLVVQPRAGRQVEARLSRLPEVRQLSTVSGELDYLLLLRTASASRLDAVLDEIGGIEGVVRTTTSIVLARRIDRTA